MLHFDISSSRYDFFGFGFLDYLRLSSSLSIFLFAIYFLFSWLLSADYFSPDYFRHCHFVAIMPLRFADFAFILLLRFTAITPFLLCFFFFHFFFFDMPSYFRHFALLMSERWCAMIFLRRCFITSFSPAMPLSFSGFPFFLFLIGDWFFRLFVVSSLITLYLFRLRALFYFIYAFWYFASPLLIIFMLPFFDFSFQSFISFQLIRHCHCHADFRFGIDFPSFTQIYFSLPYFFTFHAVDVAFAPTSFSSPEDVTVRHTL